MLIYVLTYKRPTVNTLRYIPLSWLNKTKLVVQENDHALDDLYPEFERFVLPADVTNIATTRQYVLDAGPGDSPKILMLDDDLTIGVLKEPGAYNLRDATPDDMEETILPRVSRLLDTYCHVGATARNEAHLNFDKETREVGRAIRFHGLNAALVPPGVRFDRVPTIEDYDFLLQLFRTGTPNVIDCQTYVGDGGSNADGGCSEARAAVGDGHYARLLKELHPDFVDLVQKETKTKGGTWTRTDVRVQWKKAYESGRSLL